MPDALLDTTIASNSRLGLAPNYTGLYTPVAWLSIAT